MGLLSVQFPKTLARVLEQVVSSASRVTLILSGSQTRAQRGHGAGDGGADCSHLRVIPSRASAVSWIELFLALA